MPRIVAVVGDSLPLPRQFQGLEFHHTYPYLVAQWLRQQDCPTEVWQVTQAGVPIALILDRYADYRTCVGRHRRGVGVVHLGVVDCSPRPVPLSVRNLIGRLPKFLRSPIVRFLHTFRVQLLRAGPGFVFTGPVEFRRTYQRLLSQMEEDFGHVYAINILPPGPYFESRSPGVGKKIDAYNRIIGEVVQSTEGVTMVDIWKECQRPGGLEAYVSAYDGHHLSVEGHRRIYEMVVTDLDGEELLRVARSGVETVATGPEKP